MYGLKLYMTIEDFNDYIHKHLDERFKDHTFIPFKVDINERDLSIEFNLLSANPIECDNCRYKLDLNALPKENTK